MTILLKQSTAATVKLGPFLDKTDGVTEETGLASTGTELSKNGGAFAAGPALGTHDAEGWYPVSLTTGNTDTLGVLKIKVHDSATHLPVWEDYMVLPANVYDSLVSGSDALQVDTIQWAGATTATDDVALAAAPTNFAALSISVGGKVAATLVNTDVTGNVAADLQTIKTQTVTCAGGVTVPADTLASVTNITGGTITTVTNLTNAPTSGDLTATMKTSVNTEVLDVLNVDTFAEPAQGAPAATASLVAKIGYLYKHWRNKKTQTGTTWSLFNDDAATVDHKATVSDDATTFTITEIASGP